MFGIGDLVERAKDERELLRGWGILRGGELVDLQVGANARGRATGSKGEDYAISVEADLTSNCDCVAFARSRRKGCKHVWALALHWLEVGRGGQIPPQEVAPGMVELIGQLTVEQLRDVLLEMVGESAGTETAIRRKMRKT